MSFFVESLLRILAADHKPKLDTVTELADRFATETGAIVTVLHRDDTKGVLLLQALGSNGTAGPNRQEADSFTEAFATFLKRENIDPYICKTVIEEHVLKTRIVVG